MAAPPSFDCSGTLTAVERAVCNSPKVSTYDSELAKVFRSMRTQEGPGIVRDQKKWLSKRNECEQSPDVDACLETIYRERTFKLIETGLGRRQEDYSSVQPFYVLMDQAVRGDQVIYLVRDFQYKYGQMTLRFWMSVFDVELKIGDGELVCMLSVADEGDDKEGDPLCDDEYARKLFAAMASHI